ncbi:ABC transporter substrate-binding protein [Egicoccus halophilus]|uniref:4,5-dihydroxyphthalate decarboxylase n=1 Tax=Egicoccus halophilus TaxID=1670830 RepID=A0A8J3ABE6_9ACTN|nr:ABC transporter substrate-binding protein [Egicoccus halophilus]GGI07550.1 4,5-dihydroxyphthalate decarboxylase [Egicoccus halophilus]
MKKTLQLSAVLSDNPRTQPLSDGSVQAQGMDLVISSVHPSEMFWRQLHFGDFDISEMSLASLYVMADRFGKDALDWVAIPIFTSRRFFHTGIHVRADSGITDPGGLKGRKVGVPEYQQTAAVWTRGVLEDHFDVTPRDITWYMERGDGMDHASGTGFTPPDGVVINRIPREETMATFLQKRAIDASLMYIKDENLVDRSRGEITDGGEVLPLFHAAEESARYYEKSGLYPINHAVVIRRSLVEAHPWVVLNAYSAFLRANDVAYRRTVELAKDFVVPGRPEPITENPFRYGAIDNAPELETLGRYAHEQGLTARQLSSSDIFDERTLQL